MNESERQRLLRDARARLAEAAPAEAQRFAALERFCVFVGHPRSGHSVLGTLLNGHRQALVSHNLDALAYLRAGLPRGELFRLILARDARFAAEGRSMGRYGYDLPGAWLGRFERLRVIGDKRAGAASRHLAEDETLLRELPARVGLPVTAIQHVRNPWDNIASVWEWRRKRHRPELAQVADDYFERAEAAERGLARAHGAIDCVTTRHEELLSEPVKLLTRVLEALALPADAALLEACTRFVQTKPRHTRFDVRWPTGLVESIGERAQRRAAIAHYRFAAN